MGKMDYLHWSFDGGCCGLRKLKVVIFIDKCTVTS
jgi:hypothetical protein